MAEPPSLDSSCASLESAEIMDYSQLLKGNESTAATNGSISSRNSSMSIGPSINANNTHTLPVNANGSYLGTSSSVQSASSSSLNSMGDGPVGIISSGLGHANNATAGTAGAANSHASANEQRVEQENRVLKLEVDTLKMRIKSLGEENKQLRKESVSIQARAEQEEEFISNTLLKQIKALKREKETLALNYEQEEECLTNDLSRQLNQLRAEKAQLEKTLEQEQEALVSKLMKKIEKLESETSQKQQNLEQLRREKIELENKLEQEQEALVNKLWKRMDKLEAEKRHLQEKIEKATEKGSEATPAPPPPAPTTPNPPNVTAPSVIPSREVSNASPAPSSNMSCCSTPASSPAGCGLGMGLNSGNYHHGNISASSQLVPNVYVTLNSAADIANADPVTLSMSVTQLKNEVMRLRSQLVLLEKEHVDRMAKLERDEREQRENNLRLQRKLQLEMERREQLCRHLSESESSLEMDEERQFNEHGVILPCPRQRTLSSPIPPQMSPGGGSISTLATVSAHGGLHHAPHSSLTPLGRPISPAPNQHSAVGSHTYCPNCGYNFIPSASPVLNLRHTNKDKFIKPSNS